jgi:DnaJ-class molecular chaperone
MPLTREQERALFAKKKGDSNEARERIMENESKEKIAMRCDKCHGTGKLDDYNDYNANQSTCWKCKGKGSYEKGQEGRYS